MVSYVLLERPIPHNGLSSAGVVLDAGAEYKLLLHTMCYDTTVDSCFCIRVFLARTTRGVSHPLPLHTPSSSFLVLSTFVITHCNFQSPCAHWHHHMVIYT